VGNVFGKILPLPLSDYRMRYISPCKSVPIPHAGVDAKLGINEGSTDPSIVQVETSQDKGETMSIGFVSAGLWGSAAI
jgi:hypothetical protein